MFATLRDHFRHNVVGYVALFLALGGTSAYAADTVFSTDIVDGEVKTPDLATDAVTQAKLRSGAVGRLELANGVVSREKINGGAVDGSKVADDSLGALDLAPGAVGNSEIAENAVTRDKIFFSSVNGDKVENDSLSGSDIQNLDGASIQASEGWHQIGDPGEPAFEAGWQAGPLINNDVGPGFYYDAVTRRVHLRGKLNGGNGTSTCAFTLPFNRLPDSTMSYVAYLGTSNTGNTADFVLVRVGVGGVCVNRTSVGTGVHISLDGISFRVP